MQNMLQLIDESVRTYVRTYVRLVSVTCGAPKRFEIPHGRVFSAPLSDGSTLSDVYIQNAVWVYVLYVRT